MRRPCPTCGSLPRSTVKPPCRCSVPCDCSRGSHSGVCCGQLARAWVPSKQEGWRWHSRCFSCERRCAGNASRASAPGSELGFEWSDGQLGSSGQINPSLPPTCSTRMLPGRAPSSDGLQGPLTRPMEHVVATASTSMVDRICATPMKRRRSQTLSSYAYDRVRGADKPAAPVGLVIYNHARGKKKWEVGDVLISWSTLVRGTGQLIQSPVVGKDGQDMVRVAFSLAMLMENELDHVLGRGGVKASLRSQQHDVWMNYQTYGTAMQGASIGTVMVLNLVQAMTECTFHDQLCTTGAVSLTGRVFKVDGILKKAEGAAKAGQTRLVLPKHNEADATALPGALQHTLDLHLVDDAAGLLRTSVSGWGRLRSLRLPQRDVASMDLPMTFKERQWLLTVEAAVVPGHGQVHMTGDSVNEAMTEFLRYALVWARTHQKEIMALLEVVARPNNEGDGAAVRLVVDLECMKYTEHHPWAGGAGTIPDNSLDLHIHMPTTSLIEREPGCGAALGVMLAALMVGLPIPTEPKTAVLGACSPSGVLNFMAADCNERLWQTARGYGYDRILLNHADHDRALDPRYGGPVNMTAVPTTRVENMMQLLREVFDRRGKRCS